MTPSQPTAFSIPADTSPVNAPCSVQWQFCANRRSGDPLEMLRRVEALLAKLESGRLTPSAAEVRALRMLEVLQHLGTVEARALLEALAAGAPDARRTQAAHAALDRLAAGGEQ